MAAKQGFVTCLDIVVVSRTLHVLD